MAFTVPTTMSVLKMQQLLQTDQGAERLQTIIENAHHLYCYGPAHSVVVYTTEAKITNRTARYEWPILPSADGLDYVFRHHCRAGTGGSNLELTVEEYSGGAWNTLETTTGIAATANTPVTYTHTDTIPGGSTKLRVTWGRSTAAHEFTPNSLTVYPLVASLSAGKTSAGFIPQDDGLIGAAGCPVHTEFFNRAYRNALYVLQDRYQPSLSFVQEDASANMLYEPSGASLGASEWVRMGAAWLSMPYQRDATLDLRALASVNGGSTSGLVGVRQAGADGGLATFDADGAIGTGTLKLVMPGGPNSGCILEVLGTHTSGQETYVHAVNGYWKPGT